MANNRLDNQRAPRTGRYHSRGNSRDYQRGYTTLPHAVWGDPRTTGGGPGDGREAAAPGGTYTDPDITASDATNAAKLTGEGFIASPQTKWSTSTSQYITVSTYTFFWDGSAWKPGESKRGAAAPTNVFAADTQITASDATNAAKLTAEGFVAAPQTAWTTGQKMTVGTFDFNWSGTAWAAGAHA